MKLYVLGDSISLQYGPYLEANLQGIASYARKEGTEEALRDLDEAQGANGGPSTRVRAFLEAMAADKGIDADVMLLNCGLHDLKKDKETGTHQVPLDEYSANLTSIIELVRSMGIYLVWVRTTPVDNDLADQHHSVMSFSRTLEDCQAYNQVADDIMHRAGVPLLDLFTFTVNLGKDVFSDHAHFLPEVREKQGAYIAGWLTQPHFLREVQASMDVTA